MLETPKGTLANSADTDEMPQNADRMQHFISLHFLWRQKYTVYHNLEILTCNPLKYIMDNPTLLHLSIWENP